MRQKAAGKRKEKKKRHSGRFILATMLAGVSLLEEQNVPEMQQSRA
ncbi:mCG147861 [Mus musculus]|nr:mCG147861 [Mus musculus]